MQRALSWQSIVVMMACAVLLLPSAALTDTNVALNKTVTLNGSFFTNGWYGGYEVGKQTLVDGLFLTKGQRWDQGGVWWVGTSPNIVISLGGLYNIESLILQGDNNDYYKVSYWAAGSGTWQMAYSFLPVGDSGMQTRPNPDNNSARYTLPSPIVTNQFKIEAVKYGDEYFSVSEFQAYGNAVPAPASLLLLGSGLLGLAGIGRRRKQG